jgi:hypothetical protein
MFSSTNEKEPDYLAVQNICLWLSNILEIICNVRMSFFFSLQSHDHYVYDCGFTYVYLCDGIKNLKFYLNCIESIKNHVCDF